MRECEEQDKKVNCIMYPGIYRSDQIDRIDRWIAESRQNNCISQVYSLYHDHVDSHISDRSGQIDQVIDSWQPMYLQKKKKKACQLPTANNPDTNHISIVSLNLRIPFAFITPLTPSGIRYAHSATPMGFVAAMASSWDRADCPASSDVSATSTRPCSLIVSTSAGTTFLLPC